MNDLFKEFFQDETIDLASVYAGAMDVVRSEYNGQALIQYALASEDGDEKAGTGFKVLVTVATKLVEWLSRVVTFIGGLVNKFVAFVRKTYVKIQAYFANKKIESFGEDLKGKEEQTLRQLVGNDAEKYAEKKYATMDEVAKFVKLVNDWLKSIGGAVKEAETNPAKAKEDAEKALNGGTELGNLLQDHTIMFKESILDMSFKTLQNEFKLFQQMMQSQTLQHMLETGSRVAAVIRAEVDKIKAKIKAAGDNITQNAYAENKAVMTIFRILATGLSSNMTAYTNLSYKILSGNVSAYKTWLSAAKSAASASKEETK